MAKKPVAGDGMKMPQFKNETEEAEWYHTPAGRRFLKNLPLPKSYVKTTKRKMDDELRSALHSGIGVHFVNGRDIKPTDPKKLQALVDRVQSKQTQPVTIRIPQADVAAAKRLAEKAGVPYQRLLKQIIHEGLQKAS